MKPYGYVRADGQGIFIYGEHQFQDTEKGLLIPVYTAPPQRQWVGLTEEEMRTLKQRSIDDGMTRIVSDFEYIRSIEAKLKEKNT